MAGAFVRSWELTKLTLDVIRKDKELIVFPILAGVFSFIFIISMIFPIVISPMLLGDKSGINLIANWLMIFLIYLGLAFIATFFNVCVVYTAKKRFEGGNATFSESLKFAFSKIHLIFSWSIVAAIVGLVLRIIDGIAEKMGGIGEFVIKIVNSIIGGAWALLTVFVVPGMVYHGFGPFEAIKNSAITFKKTWGENLIRVFGFGLTELVFFIIGIAVGVLLIFTSVITGSVILILVSILLIVLYFLAIFVLFSLANTVYSTALYVYAEKGKVPQGFTKDALGQAFEKKR